MRANVREALRWGYLLGYVVLSVIIYATHFIQANTPVALALIIFLACLVLVGFKLTEEKPAAGEGRAKSE